MAVATDPNPSALKTVDEQGKAPSTRIRNAYQVWEICSDLDKQDNKRQKKRSRIYKQYNRFPPSDYSTLYKKGLEWQSNVNFGMMAYVVDNNLSSFFDMVTERVWAADIKTKYGKPRERAEWSDHISAAFDKMLREWDDFLLNIEQDLLDMLLYGKGIEMWEDEEGFLTEHVSADDFLVPDDTKISFNNFDLCAIKRRYSLHELYEKIESGGGEMRGWNRKAVINAMRYQRSAWKKKTEEQFTKDIAEGNITLGSHLKEHVDVYILFIRQFNGKIGKYICLQDYAPALSLTRNTGSLPAEDFQRNVIKSEGLLYAKDDFAECIADVFAVFMDCAGSGKWHRVTSLAEKIFVQCRQYDFTMNAIMDAIKVNMSLMLQAQTAEASDKIKSMVFGPYTIIPSDVPFVQQRFALPTGEATQAVQFMMLDMFRGIGEYRVGEKGTRGQPVTATQNQNDTAEAAKLSGTQLKRYNGQHTLYYRKLYRRMISLKKNEKHYECFQKFKDYLEEKGVPPEAYKWENIESITSNMLAGAGSPSYKLMAAEKTIALTNVSPKDEGQAKAVEDALAALHGRANVGRYVGKVVPDKTFNELRAGWENSMLANPFANPADVQVQPDDSHVSHLEIHFADMERTIALVNENLEKQSLSQMMGEMAAHKLLNQGGHVNAHMQMLARDEGKEDILKAFAEKLNQIQRAADKMSQDMKAAMESQQQSFDPTKDPDIAKKIALNQIEIDQATKLNNIKAAAIAQGHEMRAEITKEKAANDIAISRAKELDKIETRRKAEKAQKPETTNKPPSL